MTEGHPQLLYCVPPVMRSNLPAGLLHTTKHMQELEKRYYSNSAAGDAASAKAAAADLATLAAFFSQRGWATLSVPSSTSSSGEAKPVKQLTEEDYRELDSQLDEVRRRPDYACPTPPPSTILLLAGSVLSSALLLLADLFINNIDVLLEQDVQVWSSCSFSACIWSRR